MKNLVFLATAILVLAVSCTKFEEGRSVMLVKRKLIGTWQLTDLESNGQKVTNVGMEITLRKDDTYTSYTTIPIFGTTTENGEWEFGSEKSILRFRETGSSTLEEYTILSLSKSEIKARWLNGNDIMVGVFKAD